MNQTIELPTGKIIDLNRFIALIPNTNNENSTYLLVLDGYQQPLIINSQEIIIIKQYLQLQSSKENSYANWNKKEQIRLNHPKINKLKAKIDKMQQEQPSDEKAQFFEEFKKNIDAHRPEGRKLYQK